MIRGVIFDLGSTLIRFEGDWTEILTESSQALAEQLIKEGLNLNGRSFPETFTREIREGFQARERDWVERTTDTVLRKVLKRIGYVEVADEVVERALLQFYAVSEARWVPMEGVYDVLNHLHGKGLHLGLISNAGNESNVQRLIDNARLRSYFDPILISAAEGIRKPNPRLFEIVLAAWELAAHEVVMVGDSLGADILGAQNAGVHQIWLTAQADTPSNRAHASVIVPEATTDTIANVPSVIQSMAQTPPGG